MKKSGDKYGFHKLHGNITAEQRRKRSVMSLLIGIFLSYKHKMVKNPDRFMRAMERKGIVCRRPVFLPVHRIVKQRGLPNAEKFWSKAVSLPIYPSLEDNAVTRVTGCVRRALH